MFYLLKEILKIDQLQDNHFKDIKINIDELKLVGTIGPRDVYRLDQNGYTVLCHVRDIGSARQIYALISLFKMNSGPLKGYIIEYSYVVPDMRKKGILTALLQGARRTLGERIFSDDKQTPDAMLLWKSLMKSSSVNVIDTETGEISKASQEDFDNYYTDEVDKSADRLLFLEAMGDPKIPVRVGTIFKPHLFTKDGEE